ncbi:EstA family serine hydrolase [Fodinicola feengrottensis]|uniref:EstA family serine hydrolase n=1 Tax=Fodinicola feengrottensis TaxID=435914 RepID=A0ABN2GNK6_9ACTN
MREIQNLLDELTSAGDEIGVQVAACIDGELVVDLWSGVADVRTSRPVDGDTVFASASALKGVAAAVVAVLVDRGVLDYDAPVGKYWPEFARNGKENTTVGQVMSHSAGLPWVPDGIGVDDLFDVPALTRWLAEQPPAWEPGTASGYHGWTYGFLVGEIVRRASGRTIDEVLRDEVCAPLGVALSFGTARTERDAVIYDGGWAAWIRSLPAEFPLLRAVPVDLLAEMAERSMDSAQASIASIGSMTARGGALLYAALGNGGELNGVRLMSARTVAAATAVRTTDLDRVLLSPIAKSYGFFLGQPGGYEVGSRNTCFGMNGSGGSLAFADPDLRFSFAFTHNRLTAGSDDHAGQLVELVRAALGVPDFR